MAQPPRDAHAPLREAARRAHAKDHHQSRQLQLEDIVNDDGIRARPVYISSVSVKGNDQTKLDVIHAELKSAMQAKTFGDCCDELLLAQHRLADMSLFKSVSVFCDLGARDARSMNVTVTVEEKGLYWMHMGTDTDVNDISARASVVLRNVLGRGEQVQFKVASGTALTSSLMSQFRLVFFKPHLARPGSSTSLELLRDGVDNLHRSSHAEAHNGVRLNHVFLTKYLDHELAYEAIWRNVCDINPAASFAIRANAGHTLKSSISHTAVLDARDDHILPRSGGYVSFSQELAGLGGNVAFAKGEVKTLLATTPLPPISFSTQVAAGLLVPLGGGASVISDRFFLGGPMDLRGFKWHGVGGQERRVDPASRATDAVGGETYWKACAAAYARLHPHWGVYAMAFVNAGGLSTLAEAARMSVADVVANTRLAYGAGLAFRTALGVIELSYAIPVTAVAGDRKRRGFQIGIAMSTPA